MQNQNQMTPALMNKIMESDSIECPACDHNLFTPLNEYKKVSAFISPTGQETVVVLNHIQCVNCFAIYKNGVIPAKTVESN